MHSVGNLISRQLPTGAALLLMFQAMVTNAVAAKPAKAKIVAKVNGVEITERRLVARMMQRLPQLSFHRRFTRKIMLKLRRATLDLLIDEELLYQEARRQKLVASTTQIKQVKKRQVLAAGGPRKFAKQLVAWHMTWAEHWQEVGRRLTVRALLEREVLAPSRVTDDEVRSAYDADPKRFLRPPEVKLETMLFRIDPSAPTKSWAKAKGRADWATSRLRKGADFSKLARKLPTYRVPGMRGGDLGWVHKGRLVPALDKVAFSLKLGHHSPPIKTLEGYVIIKVAGKRPARQLAFREIAPRLKKRMISRRVKQRRDTLLSKLRAKYSVVRVNRS